jgi:hypothetical protein
VAGDEPVEHVDEPIGSHRSETAPQQPRRTQLDEERDASSGVAGNRRPVPQHEPPALVTGLLGNVREEARRLVVLEGEQGDLPPPVESRDDTRREPAEPSRARVEESGAQ